MATTTFNKKTLGLESAEPAVTPPPVTRNTTFAKKPKLPQPQAQETRHPGGPVEQMSQMRHDGL